jgi:hypothetical protein
VHALEGASQGWVKFYSQVLGKVVIDEHVSVKNYPRGVLKHQTRADKATNALAYKCAELITSVKSFE